MATTALYTNAASINPKSAAASKMPAGIKSYR